MFTGLIAEVGRVASLRRQGSEAVLSVRCAQVLGGAKAGDSIAVDGACLTVEKLSPRGFSAFLSEETLSKTTLGTLKVGGEVNLEASLRPLDRIGGHIVQGHVEGVGRVKELRPVGDGARLTVALPQGLMEFVIPKGSISFSGVSLTVAGLSGRSVTVALVPATLRGTTLGRWKAGTRVNVETDLMGRYIVTYLKGLRRTQGLSMDSLTEKGF